MCPGNGNPWSLRCILNLQHIYLNALGRTEGLALYLLALIEDCIHPSKVDAYIPAKIALHDACHHILFLCIILVVKDLALFLTDFLQNDILGILCRNTAEFLGIQRDLHRITQIILGAQHLGVRQADFHYIVFHLLHNGFFCIYSTITGVGVYRDFYVIGFSKMVLAGCEQ